MLRDTFGHEYFLTQVLSDTRLILSKLQNRQEHKTSEARIRDTIRISLLAQRIPKGLDVRLVPKRAVMNSIAPSGACGVEVFPPIHE